MRAVWDEDLASVRQHFRKPRDLLRWRENEFICGNVVGFTLYESVLHLAFGTLNLDVLKHLFAIAPLAFMQLMGMTNTEEHMGEGATLPLLYGISLAFRSESGDRLPEGAARQKRERLLPEAHVLGRDEAGEEVVDAVEARGDLGDHAVRARLACSPLQSLSCS